MVVLGLIFEGVFFPEICSVFHLDTWVSPANSREKNGKWEIFPDFLKTPPSGHRENLHQLSIFTQVSGGGQLM